MSTVSAVIIVKNEEAHLAQCLSTLQWVDEVIVLDSGSTDATCQIAESFNAQVVQSERWQGFGIQRQRAQALARCDWILMIDADERVTPELKASIQAHIQGAPTIGRMSRLSWCFGGFIRHSGWYPGLIDRLYPRRSAYYNSDLVHEKLLNPDGLPIKRLHGDLLHFTYDSMRHFLDKSAHYADLWAQGRQKQGKTTCLSIAVLHAVSCFVRMYVLKAGFLDGRPGFLLAVVSAHATFFKYADLWVRGTTQRQQVDQSVSSKRTPPRA